MGRISCYCTSCAAREINLSHTKTDLLQGEAKMRVPQVGDYVRPKSMEEKTFLKVLSIDPSGKMFHTSDHAAWFMDNRYNSWEFAEHDPKNSVTGKNFPEKGDFVLVTKTEVPFGPLHDYGVTYEVRGSHPEYGYFTLGEGDWVRTGDSWEFSYPPAEFFAIPVQYSDAASKHDEEKSPMDLLDRTWMEETAKVLGFGSRKYSSNNWRKGLAHSRLIAAALRHIMAYNDGEDLDPESGLSHIAHASCCLMFLQNGIKEHPELDDRYKK